MQRFYTASSEETIALGREMASHLAPNSIVCFFGDLGAGKTTLIKGIVQTLAGVAPEEVCSPTFSYLNIYEGKCAVYHFDLYRLGGEEDFLDLGFEEYFFAQGVCCLEWSERISSILPASVYRVTLQHASAERRVILYEIPKCEVY